MAVSEINGKRYQAETHDAAFLADWDALTPQARTEAWSLVCYHHRNLIGEQEKLRRAGGHPALVPGPRPAPAASGLASTVTVIFHSLGVLGWLSLIPAFNQQSLLLGICAVSFAAGNHAIAVIIELLAKIEQNTRSRS